MQVNNETGALLDVGAAARHAGAPVPEALIHVDGVQGFLRVPFDVKIGTICTRCQRPQDPCAEGHRRAGVSQRDVRHCVPRQIGGGQEGGLRSRHGKHARASPDCAWPRRICAKMTARHDAGSADARDEAVPGRAVSLRRCREMLINGPAPEDGLRRHIDQHQLSRACAARSCCTRSRARACMSSTGSACSSKKLQGERGAAWQWASAPDAGGMGAALQSVRPHTTDGRRSTTRRGSLGETLRGS